MVFRYLQLQADIPLPVSRALEEATLPSLEQITVEMARGARHMF